MIQISSKQLRQAAALKTKIETLQAELDSLLGGSGTTDGAPKKRILSAAGRARIVAAVRARWAREKAAKK